MNFIEPTAKRLIIQKSTSQQLEVSCLVYKCKNDTLNKHSRTYMIVLNVISTSSSLNQELLPMENLVLAFNSGKNGPISTTLMGYSSLDTYVEQFAKRLSIRFNSKITLSLNGALTNEQRQLLEKVLIEYLTSLNKQD
jgi:hypothetical protein